jgi:putative transposase
VYNWTLEQHWRKYRELSLWSSENETKKLYTANRVHDRLHSHSAAAAIEAFYVACKTARTRRKNEPEFPYPHKQKKFRTTIWKNSAIRVKDGIVRLSLAKGEDRLFFRLPSTMRHLRRENVREVRLVFDRSKDKYDWHLLVQDDRVPKRNNGLNVLGLDLGEIHPVAVSDQTQAAVFSCRELRSLFQYRNKRLADLNSLQSRCVPYSRKWKQLQWRRKRLLGKCKRKSRDILHKVSRSVVSYGVERSANLFVVGDVRGIKHNTQVNKNTRQKLAHWPHYRLTEYISYKAEEYGIQTIRISEAYSSQTCLNCGSRRKQIGRVYRCRECKFVFPRDVVGAANILSSHLYGEMGKVSPISYQYVRPYNVS